MRRWLGGIALAVPLLACQRQAEATGGGPYARDVARAVPKIEAQVGLKFKTPPKIETRSKEQVHDFLLKQFEHSSAAKELAETELSYKLLGLIPDTLHLRQLLLDVLTEQVIGYYDPEAKVLYVVDGSSPELVGVTVQHELVHALQDQYVNLDSIENATGDEDRAGAAQAVIEGEAMFEQLSIMLGSSNFASRLPGGWDRVRETIRENASSMPHFSSAPMAIQEELIFPYLNGAEFIRRFKEHDPDQAPLRDLPVSTEQILHTDAYFGTPRDMPWTVTLPAPRGAGVRTRYENTLGEFDTRLFLDQHLNNASDADRGAAGWGGDRFAVLGTARGPALVWVTVWDTPFEAAEFFDLLDVVLQRRYDGAAKQASSDSVRQWGTAKRTIRATAVTIDGRPGVVYVDVPAGTSTDLIDVARVTVKRP